MRPIPVLTHANDGLPKISNRESLGLALDQTVLREAKISTKNELGFESTHFQINSDSDPDFCWMITSKMLSIHSLVGVSYFAKFCKKKLAANLS